MKPRVYIDTSVIGGYYDEEFKDATRAFFERFKRGEIIFIVSDLLELELTGAPPRVKELLAKFPSGKFEVWLPIVGNQKPKRLN